MGKPISQDEFNDLLRTFERWATSGTTSSGSSTGGRHRRRWSAGGSLG